MDAWNILSNLWNGGEEGPPPSQPFFPHEDEHNRYTGLESIPTDYNLTGSPSNYYVPDSYRSLDNLSEQGPPMHYQTMPESTYSLYSNLAPEPSEHDIDVPESRNVYPSYEPEEPHSYPTHMQDNWTPLYTSPKFSKSVERETAKDLKFLMVNVRNVPSAPGKRGVTCMMCEMRGFHTTKKDYQGLINRPTKRCGCQFEIKVVEYPLQTWNIVVKKGFHNHPIVKDLERHPIAGKLTD